MEHFETLRALLEKDTPQIREQQSSFLRPVVQPNNYHWMPEPSNTTFAHLNEMGRCVICDGNHPSDQCIYLSEWQNYWNHSRYEESSHFPSYPPSTNDLHQEPDPSEEDQLNDMLKDRFKEMEAQFDTQIQSNAESIQRMTNQVRQLTDHLNHISHGANSNNTEEAFECPEIHHDIITEDGAEQYQESEVSVQESAPTKSQFDFYYSDSDDDEEAELLVPTAPTRKDETFHPQNADLGECFALMFEDDLPKPITSLKSEDEDLKSDISLHSHVDTLEACISQMTDEELNAEILKYICEENVEQKAEQMEEQISDLIDDPVNSGETSLFWGVQIKDIAQKLDRMELPFQVKHHTRPPDFLSFFSGNNGATKVKKVAHALNETKFFLPPYRWKRPFKSNAHGNVFNRTFKTTLKPP